MTLATERKLDRRTEVDDLRAEVIALARERDALIGEVTYLRNLLTYAFGVERWDIVLTVRDRLAGLGTTLMRRAAA